MVAPLTPHPDLRERAAAGASDAELGRHYGVDARTVLRWRTKEGVPSGWRSSRSAIPHGTRFGYNRGCRCRPCTDAYSAHALALRRARFARTRANGGIAPVRRHNASTAGNWGCLCPVCHAAVAARNEEYKKAHAPSRVSQ